jgi:hypothetical protein
MTIDNTIKRIRTANPVRTEEIASDPLLARILATPGDPRLTTTRRGRIPRRRLIIMTAFLVSLPVAGVAGAFAIGTLNHETVTTDISALDDTSLPPAPADIMDGPTGFNQLGPFTSVPRTVGDGMYIARRGDALCEWIVGGLGGCTDRQFNSGDVWFMAGLGREYDAETAPFQVNIWGFARDDIGSIRIATSSGDTVTVPVEHNAFQIKLPNTTTFGPSTSCQYIVSAEAVSASGETAPIDVSGYQQLLPRFGRPQNVSPCQLTTGTGGTGSTDATSSTTTTGSATTTNNG